MCKALYMIIYYIYILYIDTVDSHMSSGSLEPHLVVVLSLTGKVQEGPPLLTLSADVVLNSWFG